MRLPFCILIVLGDVLDDGDLHFLEAAETFEAARKRIEALADLLPGEYVVYNARTGECVSIKSRREELGPSRTVENEKIPRVMRLDL